MNIRNMLLFVGAEPETCSLRGYDVAVDRSGFVVTVAARAARFRAQPLAAQFTLRLR